MARRALVFTAALLSLAACSGENITGLDQAIYNATYSGSATFQSPVTEASSPASPTPVRISMTLSQLGQNFTGTFLLADSTGQRVYAGSVTGKTTNTGADFTFVVPAPCAGTLYGSFTVANGEISGTANGRDCNSSATGGEIGIAFTNLVRQ